MRPCAGSSVVLLGALALAADPIAAQDAEAIDEDQAIVDSLRAEWEPEELTCEEFDPPLEKDILDKIERGAVSQESAFDCESDWISTESVLQPLLPFLGEPAYAGYESPEGIEHTIAMREVALAYSSVSAVRSVMCHYAEHPQYRFDDVGVGGVARYANLWKADADEETGLWELPLSASDCDFLMVTFRTYDPDDIVHNKPFGNPLTESGTIILVHGRKFAEYLDRFGSYSVKLRPGLTELGDVESERAEAALGVMLDYFADRARAEGKKTEFPESESEDGDEDN